MEKCLLDILEEERGLVRNIDRLNDGIKILGDRLISEIDYDTADYIDHLLKEIDRMTDEKLCLNEKLEMVQCEMANYINRIIKKGE